MYLHPITELKISEIKFDRIKGEIDISTILVGDFNTAASAIDRTTRQEIGKYIEDLYDITNHLYFTDTYRTVYLTTAKYRLFTRAHCTFTWVDQMLGNETSLNRKREILSSKLSESTVAFHYKLITILYLQIFGNSTSYF